MVFARAGLVFESGLPMVEFWSDSFLWLSVAVVLGQQADIVTILSCLCYNLNGQKLSSNTLVVNTMSSVILLNLLNLAAL